MIYPPVMPLYIFLDTHSSYQPKTQLYMADQAPVDDELRSVALPFATKPVNLNGELAGDVGFDPFKFSDTGDLAKFRYVYM
jgi:hypothetical protein